MILPDTRKFQRTGTLDFLEPGYNWYRVNGARLRCDGIDNTVIMTFLRS